MKVALAAKLSKVLESWRVLFKRSFGKEFGEKRLGIWISASSTIVHVDKQAPGYKVFHRGVNTSDEMDG